jgi:ElaB/YqjD/DUF883 family membrane-anchored ribosome-binding protein
MSNITTQQLTADLKAVANDADALLKATAGDASARLSGVRERLEESVKATRARIAQMEEAVVAQTKAAAQATDQYVHENPWPSIGVAAAAGLLVGVLLGRR